MTTPLEKFRLFVSSKTETVGAAGEKPAPGQETNLAQAYAPHPPPAVTQPLRDLYVRQSPADTAWGVWFRTHNLFQNMHAYHESLKDVPTVLTEFCKHELGKQPR